MFDDLPTIEVKTGYKQRKIQFLKKSELIIISLQIIMKEEEDKKRRALQGNHQKKIG